MKGRKKLATLLFTVIALLMCSITAFAAEEGKVRIIKINVTNDDGTLAFNSKEPEKYEITDAVYDDDLEIGYEDAEIEVTARAKEGYFFDPDHVKASFYKDDRGVRQNDIEWEDYDTVTIYIEVRVISGELETPGYASWSYDHLGLAEWDEVYGTNKYEVNINDHKITVYGTEADLSSYLEYGKRNYFKVRAISEVYGVSASSWEKSDDLDLRGDDWRYEYGPSLGGGNYPNNNPGYIHKGTWIREYDGYWYYYNNSGRKQTGWTQLSGSWYYLQPGSGRMLTGWQFVNGNWYYMQESGEMLTGWQYINNNWYYMESSGKMLTGWQYINGQWYYLSENRAPVGHMYTGWNTINGKRYYFSEYEAPVGHMYANRTARDTQGRTYHFAPDGVCY